MIKLKRGKTELTPEALTEEERELLNKCADIIDDIAYPLHNDEGIISASEFNVAVTGGTLLLVAGLLRDYADGYTLDICDREHGDNYYWTEDGIFDA